MATKIIAAEWVILDNLSNPDEDIERDTATGKNNINRILKEFSCHEGEAQLFLHTVESTIFLSRNKKGELFNELDKGKETITGGEMEKRDKKHSLSPQKVIQLHRRGNNQSDKE